MELAKSVQVFVDLSQFDLQGLMSNVIRLSSLLTGCLNIVFENK